MLSLSIVIPAYNEEGRLPATLDTILVYIDRTGQRAEIIVVDDGSTDRTAAIVQGYGKQHPFIRLLQNPGNRGKGYAVRHGMLAATGDWLLLSDADLSAPIEELETLRVAAERHAAVIAIGSRALDRSLIDVRQPAFREYSGRVFNLFMRFSTGLPFMDTQCGFKLYRRPEAREIFSRQTLDGFSFDVEDLMIAKARGLKVIEVPVRWSNVEGSKVDMSQGLKSFLDVLRIRWNSFWWTIQRLSTEYSSWRAMIRRLPQLVRITLMAAGGLLFLITFTPVVPWTAAHLTANWSDSDGDVLIVLGGSTVTAPGFPAGKILGESSYWRALHAVQAWRLGHFQTILLVGKDSGETIGPLLIAYGVPGSTIIVENRSTNTHENALLAKPILARFHGRFVLLTSDYHMLRASRCFAREGIPVITRPFPDVLKRSNSLAFRWQGFWLVSGELVSIVYYWTRDWI